MKVFALYNIKGGVGKTTAAVNLSWLSAREAVRTLIWDLDPQGAATFTFRIKPKVQGGGREVMRDADAFHSSIKGTDFDYLDLLPADFSYRNLDRILDRGGEPEERLARVLEPLVSEYDRIFLDCPANISLLSENVFSAADVLLVPTIPTVLSLRTLARLMKHLKTRDSRPPAVLPFFSMVDRRKRLHREVCDFAAEAGLGFLSKEIPYSSVIEQMGVRRNPVGAYAHSSAPSRACAELWAEIGSRLSDGATDVGVSSGPTGKSVRALLDAAERSASVRSRSNARPGVTRVAEKWRNMTGHEPDEPREVEFKLRMRSEGDFDELARLATGTAHWPERTVIQENHFFDTRDADLREAGYALRLRIEERRRLLTAKGPATRSEGGLTDRPEVEVEVEPAEAERILSGDLAPLDLLAARESSRLIDLLSSWAGGQPLAHVGSFKNVRRHVGPVQLVGRGGSVEVSFEMDRTELPGDRVDFEVEVEIPEAHATVCRAALEDLLARAGIPWETAPSKAQRFFEALAGRDPRAV